MKRPILLLLPLILLLGAAKPVEKALPPFLTLPSSVTVRDPRTLVVENYGEAEFRQPGGHHVDVQRGQHWTASLALSGAASKAGGKDVWAAMKPALLAGGWTVQSEFDENPFSAVIRLRRPGQNAFASFGIFGPADIRMELVDVGPPDFGFAFSAPDPTPETISATSGDFPYLPSLPGAKQTYSKGNASPMLVRLPGSSEDQVVGTASIVKEYSEPAGLSNLYFVTAYHGGLIGAGWDIVSESEGIHQGDSAILAHYTKNGRNIWAALHRGNGTITLRVADAAANDLAAQLAKDCHIPLYGVFFDFNKATLKPESTAVLEQVRAMLAKVANLKVEVQGHTDNVGTDAYNLGLSDARANSVMAWLTAHGIAAARLTAKGYGETHPVASNNDDAGRAKNRRVEIAKPGCTAAP